MFKKITVFTVMAMLCLNFTVCAQDQVSNVKPLKVGDKVPERFWQREHLLYKDADTVKQTLEKYRGGLLILDFWSTWCGPCVRSVPKLNALMREYGPHANIILMSNDKQLRIKKFFSTNSYGLGNTLPVFRPDEMMKAYFPHLSIPHLIWINADGRIIAITGSNELVPENIKLTLSGARLDVAVKDLVLPTVDQKP